MKFSKQIALLLSFALMATACETTDSPMMETPEKGMQAARPIEGSIGTDFCECDESCLSFGVEAQPHPAIGYAFAVELKKTTTCAAASMSGPKCMYKGEKYGIAFVFDPYDPDRFELSDFEEVVAISVDTQGNRHAQVYENPDGTSLSVYHESTLYFKWKLGHEHPTPEISNILTGGICIIGILTDPCCPERDFRGRLMRPIVPRPF